LTADAAILARNGIKMQKNAKKQTAHHALPTANATEGTAYTTYDDHQVRTAETITVTELLEKTMTDAAGTATRN
jgi:hypothetical protein